MKKIVQAYRLVFLQRSILFCIVSSLCCFCTQSFAQKKKPQNLPKIDKVLFLPGFSLGINKTDFILDPAKNIHQSDSLFSIEPQAGSGFNIGIMTEFRISEHLTARFIPDLSFTSRTLVYKFDTSGIKDLKNQFSSSHAVESTFLEFPFDLKYRSNRINNYRMYVVGGFKYSIDMASNKKSKDNAAILNPYKARVKIDSNDYGYMLGFGFDCYMEYFRFSPEIKMYHGLNNLITHDGKIFSESISSLHSKVFLISFIFQ